MKNGTSALLASFFAIIFASSAIAQAWPTKPIRFVVPFAAGGANDLMARAAAEGAGGTLGSDIVGKAARWLHILDQRRIPQSLKVPQIVNVVIGGKTPP